MKTTNTSPYKNLSELVAAYETILAREGLAPLDGETLDARFLEKRDDTLYFMEEARKKADAELDRLLGELKTFSSQVKTDWALGKLTDDQIHEMYRDFSGNPEEFPKDKLDKEAIAQLSYGWMPCLTNPKDIPDWGKQ